MRTVIQFSVLRFHSFVVVVVLFFFLVGLKDPKISALTNFFGAHFPVAHEATQQG